MVELIIVIAVIGILATMLIPSLFRASSQHARDARRIRDMNSIQQAMEQCFGLLGSLYPTSIPFGASMSCSGEIPLNPVPLDPLDPRVTPPYAAPTVSSTSYCACAYLEKKAPNSNNTNCTFTGITPPVGGGGFYCVKNTQ